MAAVTPAPARPLSTKAQDAIGQIAIAARMGQLPAGPVKPAPTWDADLGAGWNERNPVILDPLALVIQCH